MKFKHISGPIAPVLISFAIGASAAGYLTVNNAMQTPSKPPTQNVRVVSDEDTISPSPTETTESPSPTASSVETTAPPVEGDDGSMGGPVYDPSHQAEPTYVIDTPADEPADTPASTPTPEDTETEVPVIGTAYPKPKPPEPEPSSSVDRSDVEVQGADPQAG